MHIMPAKKKSTSRSAGVGSRSTRKKGLWGRLNRTPKLLLVALIVGSLGFIGVKLQQSSGATAFYFVGVHPQAIMQPESSSGRALKSLTAWNGKIYAGYGDWDKNSGPVSLTAFDPATNTFAATAEHVSDTESIDNTQVINNKLYMLHVDPKSHNGAAFTQGNASTSVTGSTWANVSKPTMTHVFGITPGFSANEVFISGQLDEGSSTNEVAKVYRSTDGGATWSESLSVPSRGGFNRMMFISKLGDKIYAQSLSMTDFNGSGFEAKAWVYSGNGWAKATPIARVSQPYKGAEFAGKIILQSAPAGGALLSYDGRNTATIRPSVKDYKIHTDGYLYALTHFDNNLAVMRTKDLVTWEHITNTPANARSLAVLNTTLYVGTSESELYRAPIDPSSKDSTPPTATMVAPAPGSGVYTATTANEFAVKAEDIASIKNVEFYVGAHLIGSTSSKSSNIAGCAFGSCFNHVATYPGTYSVKWNGDYVPAGSYDLKAIAYDIYGNSTSTPLTPVVVPEGLYPPDTEKPVISVVAPTTETRNRGGITVTANISDNKSLALFEVEIDGNNVYSGLTYSLSKKFSTTKGSHTLTLRATDRAGNIAEKTMTLFVR
jgi:hypothetical protein